ncbi:MAG: acyl-CoA synthetase [Gammaproteobacteria bacterium]|nr:acyl-CoA synthetase [Gammaproteobacteria bacterium]
MQPEVSIAEAQEAIAAAIPDREALVFRDRRFTYAQWNERTRRLGNYLHGLGLGCQRPRSELAGWESGQDHLALYLYNGNEYLEGMLGAYKARVAPFNVNYRYVDDELVYLLNDAAARVMIYHAEFAPRVAAVRERVPTLTHLIQVADDSGHDLLPGAVDYETALAESSTQRPDVAFSPDDLYILYTGGTTGMPKGVLWRQSDILVAALGGGAHASLEDLVKAAEGGGMRMLPAAPFMHGAGHWIAFTALHGGHTCIIQDEVKRFDPADVLTVCQREGVNFLQIVGDAFGRPLLDELARGNYDLAALNILLSGGAPLNASLKAQFLELLPQLTVVDGLGSSETGGQGSHISNREAGAATGRFTPGPDNVIVDETMSRVLEPGHDGMGWWAKRGRVPLGYLGDEAKTRKTFITIGDARYAVPGDRARHLADGTVELHGRDSVTINSGGEKIFAEEVEHAIKQHPAVYDAVVAGRPSERWGSEVVAVVRLRDGASVSEAELIESCSAHLARYKLPKQIVLRDEIVRSPSGKADYRWAKEQAAAAADAGETHAGSR